MDCPRCGAESPDDARFCPSCGAMLASSGSQERKLVSILFVDMVDSTARADGADPEDVLDRNNIYFVDVRSRIERHGGAVEKYIGDAVMAVFGAPRASAEDAERAVRAGLSILDGIAELNERHPDLDLAVRAAVCTGEAVVAVDAAPEEALATGDIVNTAARLQSSAAPDSLVVDDETHRLTRHVFTFEHLEPVVAKGKAVPLSVWAVSGALAAPSRSTPGTPLVGRDREIELVAALWQRAVDEGRPQLVTVLGPPGIGKTRFAREIAERVASDGGRAVWGRSLPYEEPTPYLAAADMLRGLAGIYENDPTDVAREKLATAVAEALEGSDGRDVTRYLSVLLGLGIDPKPDEPIHLQFSFRTVVEGLAEQQPILLVFEDAHWADETLLDLIEYLVAHIHETRIVVLVVARPELLEKRQGWGGGMIAQTTLPLEPLSKEASAAIADALVPAVSGSNLDRVVSLAEGNPLFLEELLAAVADEAAGDELPSTVRAAIAARIDALPPAPRTALLHASVIGQSFWRDVLVAASHSGDVDDALEALEARRLITRRRQSRLAGDVEFAFRHVLIRDVAYATLSRATRRELHGSVARHVENVLADPADLASLLAHHWREGGDLEAARGYLILAAERARDALAVEETYDLFSRALELATTDEERLRIRYLRGMALAELEDYPRADTELAAVLPHLDGEREVEATLARAGATHWTEQTTETLALADRALELVRSRGPAELEALALARRGHGLAMRGEAGDLEDAREIGDRALDLWPEGSRVLELAEHYHLHANVYYWTGRYERALELSERAASVGGVDPRSAEALLRGSGLEGLALAGMGRYEEAVEIGNRTIETARQLGRRDSVVTNYSTSPLRQIFAVQEALDRSQVVADRLGRSWFNMPWLNARADVIASQLMQGDVGAVAAAWDDLWDEVVAAPAWERWLITCRLSANRAEAEADAGRLDDALLWARRALELATQSGRRKYEISARTTLGRVLTAQGEAEAAVAELQTAVARSDDLGSPLFRWESRAELSRAQRRLSNDGDEADRNASDAVAIIDEIVVGLSDEHAAAYLAARPVVEARELAR